MTGESQNVRTIPIQMDCGDEAMARCRVDDPMDQQDEKSWPHTFPRQKCQQSARRTPPTTSKSSSGGRLAPQAPPSKQGSEPPPPQQQEASKQSTAEEQIRRISLELADLRQQVLNFSGKPGDKQKSESSPTKPPSLPTTEASTTAMQWLLGQVRPPHQRHLQILRLQAPLKHHLLSKLAAARRRREPCLWKLKRLRLPKPLGNQLPRQCLLQLVAVAARKSPHRNPRLFQCLLTLTILYLVLLVTLQKLYP